MYSKIYDKLILKAFLKIGSDLGRTIEHRPNMFDIANS